MTEPTPTTERLEQLVATWREKAARYVRGESSASEFGRCEAWSNCADQLEAALAAAPPAQAEAGEMPVSDAQFSEAQQKLQVAEATIRAVAADSDSFEKQLAEAHAEIERLRESRRTFIGLSQKAESERSRLKADGEALRERLKALPRYSSADGGYVVVLASDLDAALSAPAPTPEAAPAAPPAEGEQSDAHATRQVEGREGGEYEKDVAIVRELMAWAYRCPNAEGKGHIQSTLLPSAQEMLERWKPEASASSALPAQASGWLPIESLDDPDVSVLLWTPVERLYSPPILDTMQSEMRVSTKRHWTWATYWQPLPDAPRSGATPEGT